MADVNQVGSPLGMDQNNNGNSAMLAAAQQLVQAVNGLQQVLAAALPGGNAISLTAGAATGDYLTIVVAGTTYKLALLAN